VHIDFTIISIHVGWCHPRQLHSYFFKFLSILRRFMEYTGELDHRHFSKNFGFLDEKREKEIQALSKKLKKTKNLDAKEEIKKELYQ
jgi:hypothetical protein